MAIKCPSCSRKVQEGSAFCAHCGAQIVGIAPDQAELALAALDKIKAKVESKVSEEPEKRDAAKRYAAASATLVSQFCRMFEGFLDQAERMKPGPAVLRNANWLQEIKALLVMLEECSGIPVDAEKAASVDMSPVPDGCFDIHFEWMKIHEHSVELSKRFRAFIEKPNRADSQAWGQGVREITARIDKVLEANDKLIRDMKAGDLQDAAVNHR